MFTLNAFENFHSERPHKSVYNTPNNIFVHDAESIQMNGRALSTSTYPIIVAFFKL